MPFAEGSQLVPLFAAGEVGHVGDHPMVVSGQQLRGTCHPCAATACSVCSSLVREGLLKHGGEQFPYRFVIALEKVGLQRRPGRSASRVPAPAQRDREVLPGCCEAVTRAGCHRHRTGRAPAGAHRRLRPAPIARTNPPWSRWARVLNRRGSTPAGVDTRPCIGPRPGGKGE